MRYRMPDYYCSFKCIADRCPKTCCSGWEIVIDEDSLSKYLEEPGEKGKYICEHVDKDESIFKRCGEDCSFLAEDGLCNLHRNIGEEYLCDTCRRYPRHFEEYGDLVEGALSISCPVVANIVLSRENTNKFLTRDKLTNNKGNNSSFFKNRIRDYVKGEEFDYYLLEEMIEVRKTIFGLLKSENLFSYKIHNMLLISEKIQSKLYEYEKLGIKRYLPFYRNSLFSDIDLLSKARSSTQLDTDYKSRRKYLSEYIDMLLGLEMINDEWPVHMDMIKKTLYVDMDEDEYSKLCIDFEKYMSDRMYEYENIMVYFIYTYFLGCVYDYNALAMVKFSILCTLVIREWGMANWHNNKRIFTTEDNEKICYTFSRQIEHSDNNLLSMEGIITAHPLFVYDNFKKII